MYGLCIVLKLYKKGISRFKNIGKCCEFRLFIYFFFKTASTLEIQLEVDRDNQDFVVSLRS